MPNSIVLALAVLLLATDSFAASAPLSIPQVALYQGADREKLLIEGAKSEGQLTSSTTPTPGSKRSSKSSKKNIHSSESPNGATTRRTSSAKCHRGSEQRRPDSRRCCRNHRRRHGCDESRRNLLKSTFRPRRAIIRRRRSWPKGKRGFFYLPNRETYNSLGFNTKVISPLPSAPRGLKDLLDPKWKGKMAITNTTTGRAGSAT